MLSVHDGTVVRDPGARIAPPEPIDLNAKSRAFEVPRVEPDLRPVAKEVIDALALEVVASQVTGRRAESPFDRNAACAYSLTFSLRHPTITSQDSPEVIARAISDRMDEGGRHAVAMLEETRQAFRAELVYQKWQRLEERLREAQKKQAAASEGAEQAGADARAAIVADENPEPAERRVRKFRTEEEVQRNRAEGLQGLVNDARKECEDALLVKFQERLHEVRTEATSRAGQAKRRIAALVAELLDEIFFWDGVLVGTEGTRRLAILGGWVGNPHSEFPPAMDA
jgi:hypothetical protein